MKTLFGKLAVRADADAQIGTGHVMRCLALAQAWIDRGGSVTWISSRLPHALRTRLEVEKIVVCTDLDVEADILIVDGYHFSAADRAAWRKAGRVMLAVDDLADSDLSAADVILNHNAYASGTMYSGQRSLCGSRFALLRREFRPSQFTAPEPRTILITMGGSDPHNDTRAVLEELRSIENIHRIVLAGPANRHVDTLRAFPGTEILVNPPDVPAVMRRAAVAISAAGSTCWELAAIGVPMLLRVIAENQRGISEHLLQQEAARPFSTAALHELLDSPVARESIAGNARALVDGRGADRVAMYLACHPLTLRRATVEDAKRLFEWTNDPATRAASFSQDPIAWETHVAWLGRRLESPLTEFFIALDGDQAVGTVRFDKQDGGSATISLSLAPEARGGGLAARLIALGTFTVLDSGFCQTVHGWVKAVNERSRRAFLRAGFREFQHADLQGIPSVEFVSPLDSVAPPL